jgi:hypothetical protein
MKRKKFNYTKKNGYNNNYDIMVINESSEHIAGIDFSKLSEEEANIVESIQNEYEGKLKPYMKAYRNFIKENIQE